MVIGAPPARRRRNLRRVFVPILPGVTGRDRALACVAALVGIVVVGVQGALVHGTAWASPWIVAPIGASAVLLFAVPTSPMAQPWPIIGGNSLGALIGFAVGKALGHGSIACGVAVAIAIAAMSVTRSLHPPGGAAALTGALSGPVAASAGWLFPLLPLAMNAIVLTACGWLFHRMRGRTYPHRRQVRRPTADPAPSQRVGVREQDIDAVVAEIGESYDIERDDLRLLLNALEARVLARQRPDLACAEIMSRDLITVTRDTDPAVARALLLEHGVRVLPVVDDAGRPVGAIGLRELAQPGGTVAHVMTPPLTIEPARPATLLVAPLTDGHRHAAMVVDPHDARLLGLVTQADLLAALAHPRPDEDPQLTSPTSAGR
jgi:CBS domain-containing membrane protein